MNNQPQNGHYEFASFRLDVKNCLLTHGDEKIPLTPKEFGVLLLLIENAGRVITKDELLEVVWKDSYVEEATLTRNISWLRRKLGANGANETKIIETVPKRGYRFLPEVTTGRSELIIEEETIQQIQIEEIIEITASPVPVDTSIKEKPVNTTEREIIDTAPVALPAAPTKRRFSTFWILPALIIFVLLGFLAYRSVNTAKNPAVLLAAKIVPFSGLPGRENSPAFSPNGKQIVFSWDGGVEGAKMNIYVKLVGAGEPVRLTTSETDDINPVFSPDGESIAFVRAFPEHNEIILIPALGGAERRIYERASYASISFSPDGKLLAAAELDHSNNQAGIFTINLQTGEKTRMTEPAAPAVDHTPRFSPDGKNLAFIRYFNSFRREIFVLPTGGGELRQITDDNTRIYGLAWNSDSESLFFTSFRNANQLNLWQVQPKENAEPQLISTGSKNLQDLTVSPDGKIIAFVEEIIDENIWQIEPSASARALIRSTRADHSQQFSPDGTKIVFASDRTGNYEIWLSDSDGKNQRQMTDSNGSAGSPRFSPDGKLIVYDAQIAGGSDLYVVSVNGGAPRRLTENAENNSLPAWSADGNWIFFISNRSGDDQIWKMPKNGGEAAQVTKQGAFEMFAAPDGKRIIYSKGAGKSGLWSVGIDGSGEKPIPDLAEAGAWRSWTVTSGGVYYTAFSTQLPLQIKFYDFQSVKTTAITTSDKFPLLYYQNLSVSNDGERILYAQTDQTSAGIMLVEIIR